MLNRLYQFLGVVLLAGYGLMSLLGWELDNPVVVRPAPPVGALVGSSSGGWTGRSSTYHSYYYYSSGTRSGVGGGGSGGK
jgi:hypothetical protein